MKLQVLKMNSFTRTFFAKIFAERFSNFIHDFCENCFRKPKLLLTSDRLICLNY